MTTYSGTAAGGVPGILGTTSITANGVKGTSTSGWSAVYGEASANNAAAVHGATTAAGYGVYGHGGSSGTGVYGITNAASLTNPGVAGLGSSNGTGGVGVYGLGNDGMYAEGYTTGITARNVVGSVAGYFSGSVSKTSGTFLIDHPLDPENKYLSHSFVESPDMKNIYDGVATADASGNATVALPNYFEALNKDIRYQLTPIGGSAPNLHVKQEVRAGSFVIAGAQPGQRVSWQVTGVRQDAWALAHPVVVEEDKPTHEKGFYKHPEVHGQPESKTIPRLRSRRPQAPTPLPSP